MFDLSIRRMDREEAAQARYDEIYAEIEADWREEYDREFGKEYRAKHPFRADTAKLHRMTEKRMSDERATED